MDEGSSIKIIPYGQPGFDFHKQPVTIVQRDGTTFTIGLSDFNVLTQEALLWCCNYAIQLGTAAILLVVVAILTGSKKRRSALFACNIFALIMVIVRGGLVMEFVFGKFFDAYNYMSIDQSDIPWASYYSRIAYSTSSMVLKAVVQVTLILQTRVVCASSPKLNLAFTLGATAISLLSTSLLFVTVVQYGVTTMKKGWYNGGWIYNSSKAIYATSICLFSLVFVLKLAFAIRRRNSLGLKKFGVVQILFTMGCQTMLVPAIFSLADSLVVMDTLSAITPALTALMLPLSGMWATASIESQEPMAAVGIGSYKSLESSSSRSWKNQSQGSNSFHSIKSERDVEAFHAQ